MSEVVCAATLKTCDADTGHCAQTKSGTLNLKFVRSYWLMPALHAEVETLALELNRPFSTAKSSSDLAVQMI